MSDKAVVIISTGETEKALTGLMYAQNAIRFGWLEDVKVIFFGPAQNLVIDNEQVKKAALEIAESEKPMFCRFLSDRDGNSDQLRAIGMNVKYVGPVISDLLKQGYAPLVF
ncbi:MAG: hypothetical protein R6U50_01765 [Desulfobacterales bacterium]